MVSIQFPQKSTFGTLTATKLVCPELDSGAGDLDIKRAGSLKLSIQSAYLAMSADPKILAGKCLRDNVNAVILNPDDSGALTSLMNVGNSPTFAGQSIVTPPLYGVANKEWVGCSYVGETRNIGVDWVDAQHAITNKGGDNINLLFFVPLPTNLYGKKLYLKDVRVGLTDADATDYLSTVRVIGMLYGANVNLNSNSDDITAPAKNVTTFTAVALDAYAFAYIYLSLLCTDAGDIDIETVEVEAYYDT